MKTYESKHTTTRVNEARDSSATGQRASGGLPQVPAIWIRGYRYASHHLIGAHRFLHHDLWKKKGFQEVADFLSSSQEPSNNRAVSISTPQGSGHSNLQITKEPEHFTKKGGDLIEDKY